MEAATVVKISQVVGRGDVEFGSQPKIRHKTYENDFSLDGMVTEILEICSAFPVDTDKAEVVPRAKRGLLLF